MADTGSTLKDALTNMRTHLLTKQATWGLIDVYDHPAYTTGITGPALALEIETAVARPAEFGDGISVDWEVEIRITYFTEMVRLSAAYIDTVDTLGEIMEFLIESPTPNAFGDLLVSAASPGPQIGAIQNSPVGQQLFGGYVTVMLTHTRQHTIS